MPDFSDLISKINKLPEFDDVFTVEWQGRSTDTAISTVENALGVRIRGSYRDFIFATGGGGLDSLYISPIPADEPLVGCYSDTLHYRDDWVPHKLPQHLVVVQRDRDDNEPVCLDTSRDLNGDNPVVLFYLNSGHIQRLADSFIDYYQDFLSPYFDEAGL